MSEQQKYDPKTTAQRILLPENERDNYYGTNVTDLARAYLELENNYAELKEDIREDRVKPDDYLYLATINKALETENDTLTAALNKIGMLASSEHAYTSEFTERVRNIVQGALK